MKNHDFYKQAFGCSFYILFLIQCERFCCSVNITQDFLTFILVFLVFSAGVITAYLFLN